MTKFLGYSVVKNDGSVIFSALRHSLVRRKYEEISQCGIECRIQEMWEGAPVSSVSFEHTQKAKKK